MSNLATVKLVRVPASVVEQTQRHLRDMGRRGFEGFVLWAGTNEASGFEVRHAVVPEQRASRSELGVCVMVGAAELHRLNVWLFRERLALIAQVHSHPGEAYHSATDDAYPIVTAVGSFSLVVPDFAVRPFSLGQCAVYRLSQRATWDELAPAQVAQTFLLKD